MREKIHLVFGYYDGPIEGIADYHGVPHFFKALYSKDTEDYETIFSLMPLSSENLQRFNRIMKASEEEEKTDSMKDEKRLLYESVNRDFALAPPEVFRSKPKLLCLKSGADGVFEVTWENV